GCAQEEEPALAFAARLLEALAGLPEVDDAANLLLGLDLAADMVELDAPVRVAGLEGLHLRDTHQSQRPEEDGEVDEEEERQDDQVLEEGRAGRLQEPPKHSGRLPPGLGVAEREPQQPEDRQ